MKFDPESIKKAAKEDFDSAWTSGKDHIKKAGLNQQYPHTSFNFGKAHPV